MGIASAAWRAAVRAGKAPQPIGYAKSRTPIWDPKAVQDWGDTADGNFKTDTSEK
ncbi:hypothetical protein [Streptomyces sp. BE133]|uniref:hypothetical protein n=1 Tax=Streptomyces sp. BE133 TaxID=3002523 RepID=UPI002E79FBDD|nr:hypothetical protein [Streptomyces sp. BE133]MEE1812695.1 hypothetical protein [Streptomyces sp. BE133]